jgi:hypothetical protein
LRIDGHHESVFPFHFGPSEKLEATIPPKCAKGPSVPANNPADVTNTSPSDLENQVFAVNASGDEMPFKYDLTSGMPLPPAFGAQYDTRIAAIVPAMSP